MKKNNWLWIIGGALIIGYSLLLFAGEKIHAMSYVSSVMYYVGIAMELTAILLDKGKSNTIAYLSGCLAFAVLIIPMALPFSPWTFSIKSIVSVVTYATLAIIAKKMHKEHKWVQALGTAFIIVFATCIGVGIIGNMLYSAIENQNVIDFAKGFVNVTGTANKLLAGAMFIFIGKIKK